MISEKVFDHSTKKWVAPFLTIWIGQALSLVGSQLVQFAMVWWLTKTTGSARMLATASIIGLLPQVILGPFVGTLVDRWNRRLIMIVADSISALAIVVMTYLFWSNQIQIWHFFIIMFIRSICAGFQQPAMQASVTLMVPKDYYSRVQGINQAMMGLMTIVAAPVGALLLSVLPMYGILAIDIVTAIIAVIPMLLIRIPQPVRQLSIELAGNKPTVWQDFKEGLHYVFSWSGLVMILVITMLINLLLTPASSLLPILVTKAYLGEAAQFAWMSSAFGIGTIVGGVLLGIWGGFRRRIVTALSGLVVLGVVIILLGLVPAQAFYLAFALAFALGFVTPIINGPLFAVVQSTVDPQMQGRVFTLIMSFATAMSPLGLIIAGPVADAFGVRIWYVIGGALTILMAVVSFSIPAVMHIEDSQSPRLPGQETAALTPGA
jgi:MFS transporter, DHA3 family, macrolide efflux protein